MKTFIYITVVLVSAISTFFFTRNFYEYRLKECQQDTKICQQNLVNKENETRNLNDIYLLSLKTKAETNIEKSNLYFDYKTVETEDGSFKISIFLDGKNQGGADAADLRISFKNLQVKYIVNGEAFPAYPRKLTKDNYILVTGTATLLGSKFVYGHRGLFTEFIVTKINPLEKSEAMLDLEETRIYLKGESVFDKVKTFKKIIFN